MIYFIQCGENGPIKIGTSDNPEERMAQLQIGNPYELKLIWVYYGDEWTEVVIHIRFKHENIRGEWFRPSTGLFKFIRAYLPNTFESLGFYGKYESIERFNGQCGFRMFGRAFIVRDPDSKSVTVMDRFSTVLGSFDLE